MFPARLTRALVGGGALIVFAAACFTRADADLWGHLRFGLDALATRHLTAVDPYSFTQDVPWINHEWLSEVQMALAYRALGTAGLSLLKAGLVFGVLALVWSGLRDARFAVRLVVLLLLGFGTLHMWATIRPQLWSFLSVALLCRVLIADRPAMRWWLPPLFALWVNCHGGWVVGLGVVGVWSAASVIQPADRGEAPGVRRLTPILQWTPVLLATVAATLCNPYGWRLWLFVGETVRMTRAIEEWQPLWVAPVINWIPWGVAIAAAVWLLRRPHGPRLPAALVLAMLAYSSARVMRIESLFVTASAILLAPWIAARWPRQPKRQPVMRLNVQYTLSAIVLMAAVVASGWIATRALRCIPVFGEWAPDVETARHLENAQPGRLVTPFDWGEYAIWHVGPRLRVSIDGRRETIYSDARLAENDAVLAGEAAGLAALDRWQPEYAWLPAESQRTKTWLAGHGYRIEIETAHDFLAVRSDLPVLVIPSPNRHPAPGQSCFP